jgi:ribonuclease G
MSDFGLVQITRQRIRQNILQAMKEVCPYCMGTGLLTKHSHIVYDLEDWLTKFKKKSKERSIIVKCHPAVAARLKEGTFKSLFKLQLKYLMRIKLVEDEALPVGQVKFFSEKTQKDLTEEVI